VLEANFNTNWKAIRSRFSDSRRSEDDASVRTLYWPDGALRAERYCTSADIRAFSRAGKHSEWQKMNPAILNQKLKTPCGFGFGAEYFCKNRPSRRSLPTCGNRSARPAGT
jgi:hypothetical protein